MFNFPDAPTNGQVFTPPGGPQYVYGNGVWKASFPPSTALGYVPEAPTDGNVYGRTNATWVMMAGGTGDNTPPGTVIWSARTTPPTGYLKADGSTVSRALYATLFSAIGTTYGTGDGSTTFGLPDLRGEFVRGFDDGRGVDSGRVQGTPQAGAMASHTHTFTGTAMPTHNHTASSGTESADHTHSGSTSSDSHNHTVSGPDKSGSYAIGGGGPPAGYSNNVGSNLVRTTTTDSHAHSFTTGGRSAAHTHAITVTAISAGTPAGTIGATPASGAETRPRNVALLACIKT